RGGVVAVALLGGSSAEAGYAALALGVAIAGTALVWQLFAVQLPGLIDRGAADLGEAERAARHLAWQSLAVLLPAALVAAAPLLDAAAAPVALLAGSAVTVVVAARLLGARPERQLAAVALAGAGAVLAVGSLL